MIQSSNINEAIRMIETHDWYWRMADYGYESRYNAAKANMKAFVTFLKTIDNAEVRETLRNMWVLVFHDKMDEYKTLKNQLLAA